MDLLSATDSRPRVLIVEDDPVSAMLIQRLFKAQNVLVDRATEGSSALKMHSANPYRLVVSDWMMPGMDGVELCREFRRLNGAYVYFILCSAKGERAERIEAFEAGVDDFLNKPLDPDELHARLMVARRILETEEGLNEQKLELEQSARLLTETNSSLRLASRRFEELFSGLPVACFTFDSDGTVQEWNKVAEKVFGLMAYEASQRPVWEVLGGQRQEAWNEGRIDDIFTKLSEPNFEWNFKSSDESEIFLASNLICLRGQSGEAIGAVCSNLDITDRVLANRKAKSFSDQLEQQKAELQVANEKLNHLAVTDGLTGLWNHRKFQEMLEEALAGVREKGSEFSLMLLDIDHFKKFNDDFGHQVGDEVLQLFAKTLKVVSRTTELPARYGGEEFAIILQRCPYDQSFGAAERFRLAINEQKWPHRGLTTSIGIATCIDPETTAKQIILQADAALYFSKQAGRNRCTHFEQMSGEAAA